MLHAMRHFGVRRFRSGFSQGLTRRKCHAVAGREEEIQGFRGARTRRPRRLLVLDQRQLEQAALLRQRRLQLLQIHTQVVGVEKLVPARATGGF